MIKSLHRTTIRIFLTGMFLLCLAFAWAQPVAFQNGIRKGMVKVKFTPSVAATLGQMPVNARGNKLTTGIQSVDLVASKVKATKMTRIFPYDARFENKLRKHGLHLWYTVEIDETIDPKTAVTQFKQLKEVTVAEVEREKAIAPYTVMPYTAGISATEALPFNDPLLKDQWHYNNTGQNGFSDADINLFEAWTQTTGASNVIVSVHDEGVDVNHNDLKANIWVNQAELNGSPNVDDDANGYVDDINGYNFEKNKGAVDAQYHGSHVAGTIAAVNNNGIGVSGVAGGNGSGNGVKIMSLQIFGEAAVEKSYVYAANNGAVISQNSWGYTITGNFEQVVLDAIDYFVAEAGDYDGSPMKGGIVIFAAGNSNSDANWYPQFHHNTFAVASIGPEWKKAGYSNFGEWVEISAPGGDSFNYGSKGGVLSTIPNNQYAYLNGTSMACPHVSGVAALALANRTRQLTNVELWNKLRTGVVNIDQYNPNHVGKLGTGAINAFLAIQNDQGLAPAAVTNLTVTGIAQEFATLTWTVPADADDGTPTVFDLYYHTQPITNGNLGSANKATINNTLSAGSQFSYELNNLLGLTTYYFTLTATDRWGNVSVISNVTNAKTNEGPTIALDEASTAIELDVDAASSTLATHEITISNNASGVLRWNHFVRQTNPSFNAAALNYPVSTDKKTSESKVATQNSTIGTAKEALRSNEAEPLAFSSVEKRYAQWPYFVIGDDNLALTNSAAAKFYVTEESGFNLTHAEMLLRHDKALGPVIMEVYKGSTPTKNNLIYAQEHNNPDTEDSFGFIALDEQLYFEQGSTFWLVFHVPAGNLFPLGIGTETDPSYSDNCFMSFNMGSTWTPLDTYARSTMAWAVAASSYNEHLGTYLSLEPGSGDVNGGQQTVTTLTAEAATLINGSYTSNLVITSNDAKNQELRVPVNLTVSGHKANIKHIDIADFGGVFIGESKTLELVLENVGYGDFSNLQFTTTGTRFKVEDYAPYEIPARGEATVKVKYSPAAAGNANSVLTITDGSQTYKISLFGLGIRPPKIALTPATQVINNVTIGDVVNAQITVKNTGLYPLKYFIPGYDTKGVSDNWPSDYHTYGYKFRTNYAAEANPIPYEFQNISATGIDITNQLLSDRNYVGVDMGFSFPYYGESMNTIYIAQKGFTTFDNSVRPLNDPRLYGTGPAGYISALGTFLTYVSQGNILYQLEADRMIIQYDNVTDGYGSTATVQMVLYANGDIRFFYDDVTFPAYTLNILIEDIAKQDGILINGLQTTDYTIKEIELYNGLALGFDYPGPNIITGVQNGSGILAPGTSSVVDVELNTSALVEGTINRSINFISNDPVTAQTSALIQLGITAGGISQPEVSTEEIAFGDVFQTAIKSNKFTIKNPGSANVDVVSMTMTDNEFIVSGDNPTTIKPGLYKVYEVGIPTDVIATLDDWLTINYADGSQDLIHLTGNVVVPPAINVDLSTLQASMAYGETSSHPLMIENTGLAPLEVSVTGKQWLSFETSSAPGSNGYTFEKYNSGENYQWIDIRETGTQMTFVDNEYSLESYWRKLTLPFPVEFYGQMFSELKIAENGVVSFEENPEMMFGSDKIPSAAYQGKHIMPYWTFGGFNTKLFPKEDVGIFYQFYDDKIIITWSYLINNFFMGDPVSAQLFLYKNGTMKFQYKVEEGGSDQTSHITLIGLQESSDNGISISHNLSLDHGNGLAIIILPAKKHVIAPGATLAGNIKLDADNIYAGQYTASLKINNNVPNSELLEKPIELTVTGDAVIAVEEEIDFGKKMVDFESWGEPKPNYVDLKIGNVGAGPLDITWAQMADGSQALSLQIWALMPSFFGDPEWRWADVSEIWGWESPVLSILPNDLLKARAVFAPSVTGNFEDELVLTTSLGETRVVLKGAAFEPAALNVTTTSITEVMNTSTEKVNRSIVFDNEEGLSDLTYNVSIDFGRATTARTTSEAMNTNGIQSQTLRSTSAQGSGSIARTQATYNRTLKHTQKESPDTFVGVGEAGTFRVATKYNAGAQGFNLSHVETWFRRATLTTGTILVEVRAGGKSIAEAVTLAEGTLQFSGTGSDNTGSWYAIKLDNPAGIYPNEDFYVVITYPLGIDYPQGTVKNEPTTPNRYFYFDFDGGKWSDIQEIPNFETLGWLMFAAEETAGNSSWLTVTSPLSGTVGMGTESSVEILIEGAYSQRGDQIADIVITSNDPKNDTVRIPVKLHMNEAPIFSKVPESIFVEEGKTLSATINVTDKEGNTFTVAPKQVNPWMTHTLTDGTLELKFAPGFGVAGNYSIALTATDQYNAVSEITIPVEIAHTNRPPKFIGENESMSFNATGLLNSFSIEDFFSDPDGDEFTFNLSSNNSSSVGVFASEREFLIRPIAVGEAKLAFTVEDSHGAITKDTITVSVDVVLGAEEEMVNHGLGVYPNPTIDVATVTVTNDWTGEVTVAVLDVNGKQYLTHQLDTMNAHEIKVDVSKLTKGIYILRATSKTKQATIKLIKK